MINERPLKDFYPRLAASPAVKEALEKAFAGKSDQIVSCLRERTELPSEFVSAHDVLYYLVKNEAKLGRGFAAEGSEAGEYPIDVMQFAGVYFVQAPQFDDLGFFATEKEAAEALTKNWFGACERNGE